jgi:hypothetical protein
MRPAPLWCWACRVEDVPVVRWPGGGYPDAETAAAVEVGDAVYAGDCFGPDAPGLFMPLQCRSCRRHLADARDDEAVLAALALDVEDATEAGQRGLWRRDDGRVLAWVSPLCPRATQRLLVPEAAAGLLRAVASGKSGGFCPEKMAASRM